MRIFENFAEAYSEVGRDLAEMGVRVKSHSVQNIVTETNEDYEMVELIGYPYKLLSVDWAHKIMTRDEMAYSAQELVDRFSDSWKNPGESFRKRPDLWCPFRDADLRFDYTYNERMRPSLRRVMDELIMRPNTRQAVISIFWPEDVKQMGGKQRIPCSMYYQFLLRGYDLHVIYTMRSCDYFNHFKVDAYLAWSVGEKIARHLSGTFRELVQVKSLTHFIGSLHCFKKDLDVAGIF